MAGAPESILVRAPNWAGDLVMSTPAFRALRGAHPAARIVLHVRRGLEPLLAGSPWFDAVVGFDPGPRGALASILRAGWLVREGRGLRRRYGPFDLGICIPDSVSAALVMRAAGVRRIVGYRRGVRGPLLHTALEAPAAWGRRRLVARERFAMGLVEAVGARALAPDGGPPREAREATSLQLYTTTDEEARADRLLAGAGVAVGRPLVAIAPGASYGSAKRWPAASFAAVGDAASGAGAEVLLVGTAEEVAVTAEVARTMERKAVDLAGSTDLGVLKALLRRSALLVCNDAGARHVAVAFGVPALVFFGPTSVAKTDLNLESVRVFETSAACRPCYRRECPIDHRCMTRIEPAPVVAAALSALSRSRARSA